MEGIVNDAGKVGAATVLYVTVPAPVPAVKANVKDTVWPTETLLAPGHAWKATGKRTVTGHVTGAEGDPTESVTVTTMDEVPVAVAPMPVMEDHALEPDAGVSEPKVVKLSVLYVPLPDDASPAKLNVDVCPMATNKDAGQVNTGRPLTVRGQHVDDDVT